MNIIIPSTYMKPEPNETSLLETECLFGETVEILDYHCDWVYCKLNTDNYYGWIKKNSLGKITSATHRVILKRTFVYENKDEKSPCVFYLPMGAKISVKNIISNWAEVFFSRDNSIQVGYVPSNHIVEINHKFNNWVNMVEQLIGTPYRWGGRDTIGIDCSALLQLGYETYGEIIPRNTKDQVNVDKKVIEDINDLKRGFVVFWEGHVGIMTDNENCIHANAFHMKTCVEPLKTIIDRMDNGNTIIKILNFN